MWPVQTLTLLLCLTDDEQLFAQAVKPAEESTAIEAPAPAKPAIEENELLIEDWA